MFSQEPARYRKNCSAGKPIPQGIAANDRGFALAAWFRETSGAGPLMINIYNLAEPAGPRLAQSNHVKAIV